MSATNVHPEVGTPPTRSDIAASRGWHANRPMVWRERIFSPLWLCLLAALGMRIFLIVHTHGVIDGDEALVGIQAQRILHGDFPIYFYGQAYMGSLEAYLVATLFSLFGASVWTLRAEPALLSLGVVWLTWRLAGILTETSALSRSTRRIFMTGAALCAAIPPLYDGVMEGRTYGGFIEMLVVILLLLIATIRLTRRWFAGASHKELAWRWAGIGFLVGLGFWIYPLIASAVLAAGLWILGRCLLEMWQRYKQRSSATSRPWWQPLRDLYLALAAIPACLFGMAPALGWGATHRWANVLYILSLGGHESRHQRLSNIIKVTKSFIACVSPRLVGGALPLQSQISANIHQLLFICGLACIVVTFALLMLACLQPTTGLAPVRQMVGLPALFALCGIFLFCVSSASEAELLGCTNDWAGRYAAPLMLALPFFFATTITMVWVFLGGRADSVDGQDGHTGGVPATRVMDGDAVGLHAMGVTDGKAVGVPIHSALHSQARPARGLARHWLMVGQVLFLLLVSGFLGTHAMTYGLADPGATYQSNYCVQDPFDDGPILAYLQEQHIHYFWANNLLAYPLLFESHLSIIGADPLPLMHPTIATNRIPSYTDAVLHADRPSMLFVIPHDDAQPQIARALDNLHVTYRLARFYAQPGYDVLIVTPLSRTVSPLESPQLDLFRCLSQ